MTHNTHPRDDRIQFVEDTHTYFIDGSSDGVISTTTLIHSFFPHFNADEVLKKMKPSVKAERYPGLTDAQIREMWSKNGKEASRLGTEMHAQIEEFYNHLIDTNNEKIAKNDDDKINTPPTEFRHFLRFHAEIVEKRGYRPYRTEWSIFDDTILLAGQLDMIYERPDHTFALYDWKRVKELKTENRWEKGMGPFANLDHCNYTHYSLQLNVYKRILETFYAITISEMCLVILHPENDTYIIAEVRDMSDTIDRLWEKRR
jgi:hypothetical protein